MQPKTSTSTNCLTAAANKLTQSDTPTLTAKEVKALAKAGIVPELKWGGDSFMYFPGIDIDPINLLMPLTAVNPVTAPGVEPRYWLMGVAVHRGYAMATDAASAAAVAVGTDAAEGMYYNSIRSRYLDACPVSAHSADAIAAKIRNMLKTHLDNSAKPKKSVYRLSVRHLAQLKQLAAYSYREESEPEKVKFPLVNILGKYYDSRRLASVADIIAYSIPASRLGSSEYRISMTAADSPDNIPLAFKVWNDEIKDKPRLCCAAVIMPLLDSGRKKSGTDHIAWTFRENPEDAEDAVKLPERGMGVPVAYPVPNGSGSICMQLPDDVSLHAAPGQSCTMAYMTRPQAQLALAALSAALKGQPAIVNGKEGCDAPEPPTRARVSRR